MKKGYIILILFLVFMIIVLIGVYVRKAAPRAFLKGEVVWVSSNLINVEKNPEYQGLFSYSNETIKFGDPHFVFGVQTANGIYTIQLDPTDRGGSSGPQTIYNLATVIKQGIRVKFPTELYGRSNSEKQPMGFSKSQVGMLDPDEIEILSQKE